MKIAEVDVAIIGGGPAGLAASLRAKKSGAEKVVLIERDKYLGGILNQCIHDGFGLITFKKQLSGCEYSQRYIDMVKEAGVDIQVDTMVLTISKDKKVYTVNSEKGIICYKAKSIILAMGCRERTRSQVRIYGTRPSGILTAGAVQKYINIEGYLPGKNVVILGSGDIGLIMARRMHLEHMNVKGVYEVMPSPGGLRRNIVQCLDDYGIPLHLSTTVIKVHGNKVLEGVTVAEVDENKKPIKGTEEYIPCDILVLSVGLIPENELSKNAGIAIHSVTKGPVVDQHMMTSIDGIFAAGNVSAVFDLVDYVSQTGETAAVGAVKYINSKYRGHGKRVSIVPGKNISFIMPQKIETGEDESISLYMRVRKPLKNVVIDVKCGDKIIKTIRKPVANPPEMISFKIDLKKEYDSDFVIDGREVEL